MADTAAAEVAAMSDEAKASRLVEIGLILDLQSRPHAQGGQTLPNNEVRALKREAQRLGAALEGK